MTDRGASEPVNPDRIRELNWVPDPRKSRCEIMDTATREVWQDCNPTPRQWYDDLQLEPNHVKAGFGSGNFDSMWFRRSPDGVEDGPVRRSEIQGRSFFFCARAPSEIPSGNPIYMVIHKYQSVIYNAGNELEIMTRDDGCEFVAFLPGRKGAPTPRLPDAWTLRKIVLDREWQIDMPVPTATYWFAGQVSFQGPVIAPQS
jgi:hypothetical protein